jgi:hypothetical protein
MKNTETVTMQTKEYRAQSARDAQATSYSDKSYWNYLEETAIEHYGKGVTDAFTQSLSDALQGNDGA